MEDRRDDLLMMLNERVGEVETQMNMLSRKIDHLLEQFTIVSTNCIMLVLYKPRESLFTNDYNPALAKELYDQLNHIIDIKRIYIYHHSSSNLTKEVIVYVATDCFYVYSCMENHLLTNLFKDENGIRLRNINNSNELIAKANMHQYPDKVQLFEF